MLLKKVIPYIVLSTIIFTSGKFVSADVPTLQRRTAPPEIEVSCRQTLGTIRDTLVQIAIGEEELSKKAKDKVAIEYYKDLADKLKISTSLNPNIDSCSSANIKILNIIVAQWQYYLATDTIEFESPKN